MSLFELSRWSDSQPALALPNSVSKPRAAATRNNVSFLIALTATLLLACAPAWGADSVAPPWSGGSSRVSSESNVAVLTYTNGATSVQYRWECPNKLADAAVTKGLFGRISFETNFAGKKEGPVDIHSSGSIEWTRPEAFAHGALSTAGDSATCRLQFKGSPDANVTIKATMAGPSLQFDVSVDQKIVKKLEFPSFAVPNEQQVKVPFATPRFNYFPEQGLFGMQVLDWIHTNATSQTGMTEIYAPLTNGEYNAVKDRAFFSVGDQLDSVFPSIPNPPSPFIQLLSGRVVIDLWGGSFQGVRSRIEDMGNNGIRNGVAIIHDWGFAGYDMKSPLYRPANPGKGGDAELNKAIQTAYKYGNLVALHQNYVDYYTDYPNFKASDIALDSDGGRQKAWYNNTAKMQSYWTKPQVMLAEAEADGKGTYDEYKTNASYIDVNSSFGPGRHVDMDASQPGAGMLVTFDDYSAKLWQAERDIHHGPVFGEGEKHWTWSGLLDGVEAQFGAGWPNNDGPHAPMLVDFDLTRIHPLQVNHGMGYYARWSSTLSSLPDDEVDLYRAQEVAFGHAPFIDKTITTGQTNLYSVNEYALVTPVAKRYGPAKVASIKYYVNGRWNDVSTTLKNGATQEQLQTVMVAYDNGMQVISNAGPQMRWNNYDIPQNGWLAHGNGIDAGTHPEERFTG